MGSEPEDVGTPVTAFISASATVGAAPGDAGELPAAPPAPELRSVVAPGATFGLLGGEPVTALSVELWSDHVLVHLVRPVSAEERRARHERFDSIRRALATEGQEPETAADLGRPQPSAHYRLSDDAGTRYAGGADYVRGGDDWWRLEVTFRPAVPLAATALSFEVTEVAGRVTARLPVSL